MSDTSPRAPLHHCVHTLFVSGTDTDVGKTYVTTLLAAHLLAQGLTVAVWKPAQTGVTRPTEGDAGWVANALGHPSQLTLHTSYHFAPPAAPSVADEAGSIQLNTLLADLNHLQSTHDMVLIEGAGGLLCPIKGQLFMVDLARHCKAPVLLVTRPHLGTLNHTLLSVELARYRGVLPLGLVINEGARPLPAEEQASLAVQTAPQQLAHYSQVPLLGYLTHQSPLPQGLAAWQQAAQAWVATWPQPLPWHFPSP